MIFGRLGVSSGPDVLLALVKTNAVPALLYGTAATALSTSSLKELSSAYDSVFKKIFRNFDNQVVLQCQYYCGCWPLSLIFEYNRFMFLSNLIMNNKLRKNNDIDNLDFNDYTAISNKYNIGHEDSVNKVKYKMWCHLEKVIFS
jgi:hypothetical protein